MGSKRTGPDLARVGGRYSDDWHRAHLINPRDVVPESIMPAYPFLASTPLDSSLTAKKLQVLRALGVPYTDVDIAGAAAAVQGKTEMDCLGGLSTGPGHSDQEQAVMSMDMGTIRGLGTIVVMVAFVGLAIWVFSGRRQQDFEEANLLPFADDAEALAQVKRQQEQNGKKGTEQ